MLNCSYSHWFAVKFYLLGQLYHQYLRKSHFIIKFCRNMADEAGSVVVKKGCQETQVPTSMLGGYLHIFLNLQV